MVPGGGRRCPVWGLVMGFLPVAARGGTRGGVCWRGLGVAKVGGSLRVVHLWPCLWGGGAGGGDVGVALLVVGGEGVGTVLYGNLDVPPGRFHVACACCAVLAVLAGCGVEVRVEGGCLGILVGLWSVGSGWLLVDGASWHGVGLGGLLVSVSCSLYALVLLVRMRGSPWVRAGVRWTECCGPVQWGR